VTQRIWADIDPSLEYVNLKVARDTDITQFWNENKSILPKLFSVVKQVLCIPASSAASERVFSTAGRRHVKAALIKTLPIPLCTSKATISCLP